MYVLAEIIFCDSLGDDVICGKLFARYGRFCRELRTDNAVRGAMREISDSEKVLRL